MVQINQGIWGLRNHLGDLKSLLTFEKVILEELEDGENPEGQAVKD